MSHRNGVLAILFLLTACDQGDPPTSPSRDLQGIHPYLPIVITDCIGARCICEDFPSDYEPSLQPNHPIGYAGDGTHSVTIRGVGTDIIHIWPASACGDSMATFAVTIGCPVCIDFRPETEPSMLNRTYSIWPTAGSHEVLLMARSGLAYYAFQGGRRPVRFDGAATLVEIL